MQNRLQLAAPAAIVVLTFYLLGCAATQRTADTPQQSLYERLGGQPAIVAVVDDFTNNVAADNRINGFFILTDATRFKQLLVEQICQASGGPCTYSGRDMKTAHAGRGITDQHFDALIEDLVKTLNKLNVPQREQTELLALLEPMRADIVTP